MHRQTQLLSSMVLFVAWPIFVRAGEPVGTGMIYQGQLKEAGVPLNGNVDLVF